jgi:hypothetical protein
MGVRKLMLLALLALALGVSCIALQSSSVGRGTCSADEDCPEEPTLTEATVRKVLEFHGGKTLDNHLAYGVHDHLEVDMDTLDLTDVQRKLVDDAFNSPNVQNTELLATAASSSFRVTPHLAYRYFASSGWTEKFHGEFVNDSIVATVNWRAEYGIDSIDPEPLRPMIERGLCYIDRELDQNKRPIVYLKTANMTGSGETDYIKLIMYTVNRADVISKDFGTGEFVTIVDMAGYSWSRSPAMSSLKELIGYLKRHFPYRLQAVYVVNTSSAFSMLWKMCKPFLPKRAIDKTHILSKKETEEVIAQKLGRDAVEQDYGGTKARGHAIADMAAYLSPDYVKAPTADTGATAAAGEE